MSETGAVVEECRTVGLKILKPHGGLQTSRWQRYGLRPVKTSFRIDALYCAGYQLRCSLATRLEHDIQQETARRILRVQLLLRIDRTSSMIFRLEEECGGAYEDRRRRFADSRGATCNRGSAVRARSRSFVRAGSAALRSRSIRRAAAAAADRSRSCPDPRCGSGRAGARAAAHAYRPPSRADRRRGRE
jgi:hypothetical protein